ncbi:hypothetical protein [Enhygromyxa salina]|uniref:NADH-quinone oxidoreductase subunit J n=1 Tax=Enhygromyxa salina TaxID=215803 RepID=A0A2S9Y027_9BACT|nr:hypothetical protein [Enhygromyxa salina]PRP98330.1 hypothetical protein ENSA7_65910 [Enhygromyxa salina]
MSASTFSFFASAVIASGAALIAMVVRQPRASLAAFGIALAALIVPLVQLRAPTVAAVVLLASGLIIALLAGLTGVSRGADAPAVARGGRSLAFGVPATLGLAGFVWVLLATGSRQVVELGPPIEPGAAFGDGDVILLQVAADHTVPALVVALLALCSVIAAVLTLVFERPEASTQSSQSPGS